MITVKLAGGPYDGDSGEHTDDYAIHGVFLPEPGRTITYRFDNDRVVDGVTVRTLTYERTIYHGTKRRKGV